MPIVSMGKPGGSIYIFDSQKKWPLLWTDDFCYDFLDHMVFLAEQKLPPYYIAFCCGLDKIIEKPPYNYDDVRRWVSHHPAFVYKIWQTTCIPLSNMILSV